ncbi:MAG: DnaJ domain-containing protein [Candidatus Lindowbacteria bacterium]|nr:DnaJ domain-containing protein [Candidatus Lindowbacteria bacterium]
MPSKNYYAVLDLDSDSSVSEIKSSFRKLALKWHPDKNKSSQAKDRFTEIYEAYDILNNERKRRAYDRKCERGESDDSFDNWTRAARKTGRDYASASYAHFWRESVLDIKTIFLGDPMPGFIEALIIDLKMFGFVSVFVALVNGPRLLSNFIHHFPEHAIASGKFGQGETAFMLAALLSLFGILGLLGFVVIFCGSSLFGHAYPEKILTVAFQIFSVNGRFSPLLHCTIGLLFAIFVWVLLFQIL